MTRSTGASKLALGVYHGHVPYRLPHKCGHKDRAAYGAYRTRDLILGYYDAYAAGDLQVWLGPEEKRTAERHGVETRPD